MRVLVVTGGIGSGKSLACSVIARLTGAAVYKADDRVKALYQEEEGLVERMEQRLGLPLRDNEGRFRKRFLADIIFSDPSALERVEAEVFPVLMEDFRRFEGSLGADVPFVVFESATVLEKPFFRHFGDFCILVDAPLEVRASRAAMRDGVSVGKVKERMASQKLMNRLSEGTISLPEVDFTVLNDAGPDELELRIADALKSLGLVGLTDNNKDNLK